MRKKFLLPTIILAISLPLISLLIKPEPSTETETRLTNSELIYVTSPKPNAKIASPLVVSGQARGTWYFEADFPVYLYDSNNKVIATGIAQAQSDWMTEDFVPFKTTLTFSGAAKGEAVLVLQKSNPSDLEEYQAEIRIPVTIFN